MWTESALGRRLVDVLIDLINNPMNSVYIYIYEAVTKESDGF